MKIISQSGNIVGEYNKVYIVDIIDSYNKKWSKIEGQLTDTHEISVLGKYKDHEQAQQVLKLLLNEPNIFVMPLEYFEEDDNFNYPESN